MYEDVLPKLQGEIACTARETAALDFAERLATAHQTMDDAFMAGMQQHFTDAELVELGLVTGAFLMLGRLHHAFGTAPMSDAGLAALRPRQES